MKKTSKSEEKDREESKEEAEKRTEGTYAPASESEGGRLALASDLSS